MARMISFSVSDYRWRVACRNSIIISVIFLLFSIVMLLAGVESNQLLSIGPAFYALGAGAVFVSMVRAGGALAPIAWYVLGTGVYFGMGSALWGLVPDLHRYYMLHAHPGDLARVNLLNSASIFIVILVALLFSGRKVSLPPSASSRGLNWMLIYRLVVPLAVLSVILDYYFFPIAEDLIVRSFQSKLSMLVPMYLLMTGMLWKNLGSSYKMLSIMIVIAILVLGVLSFSKTAVLYPILCLLAGYWTVSRSLKSLVIPLIATSLVLIFGLIPLVKEGRGSALYSDSSNSIETRVDIVDENFSSQRADSSNENPVQVLSRFSHAPFQRFLMNEYLAGRSGESLSDFWVALIPRVLWPGKPNVTRFGVELHEQFYSVRGARSALAPTYTAEAYWNLGVIGVLVISVLLGLQLGWLTRYWFLAIQGVRPAYLVVAFPAAFLGLNVETWIVASYFGGFVTLVIIWWLAQLVVPAMSNPAPGSRFSGVSSDTKAQS
jgi:hypothetical protein